jgi:hypothetical protein
LGGKDQDRYQGFNGQFLKVFYSDKKGAFVNSLSDLEEVLVFKGKQPTSEWNKL